MADKNNQIQDTSALIANSSDAQTLTRINEGRFDENLNLIVKEIMDEALGSLGWWAGQLWWFLPNRFEASQWQLHPTAPASLSALNSGIQDFTDSAAPTDYFHEPTLIPIDHATWLPTLGELKSAGVRFLVALDIIADDRPSARMLFIVPSSRSLGSDERQFLKVSSLLLPKMVVRERVRTELQFRATHDPLTGLLNRLGLNQLLQVATVTEKTLRAVLFLDLNKFKEVNDLYGHAIGDELLVHIANALSGQIRPTDAIARIGGDEFVVVAAEVASPEAAEVFAKRLWSAVAEPFTFSNGSTWLGSGSIGVALWLPGETYASALRQADMLMYRAKKSGGGLECQSFSSDPEAAFSSDGLLSITQFSQMGSNQVMGALVTVETVLRLPDTHQLGALIAESLASQSAETFGEIWLKLPKSFWLDGDRIAGLLEVISSQDAELQVHLVLSCASASFESRLVARELMDRFNVGIVLDAFGSGNRDLELLQLLTPVALIVDGLSMIPEQLGGDEQCDFDWAVPRSVVAIANVLGIEAVAPIQASAAQLKSFANLGCDLWFQAN